ncbi:hypothetical protein B0T22DRAFT_42273 [Podospora appendiculata]|uniref:Uncharacterized protein n=1 Tax=Podospora appendiculata TaxID=314037 RepID=A0AAE0XHF0_9PEZI|nr:hypothetical protein B0T22DRAFT_42273 [Podospora appendiculata]
MTYGLDNAALGGWYGAKRKRNWPDEQSTHTYALGRKIGATFFEVSRSGEWEVICPATSTTSVNHQNNLHSKEYEQHYQLLVLHLALLLCWACISRRRMGREGTVGVPAHLSTRPLVRFLECPPFLPGSIIDDKPLPRRKHLMWKDQPTEMDRVRYQPTCIFGLVAFSSHLFIFRSPIFTTSRVCRSTIPVHTSRQWTGPRDDMKRRLTPESSQTGTISSRLEPRVDDKSSS